MRLLLVVGLWACSSGDATPRPTVSSAATSSRPSLDHAAELAALSSYEDSRRSAAAWETLPPASRVLGADPMRIAALPGVTERVGLERGSAALVLLGPDGRELARATTPALPSALAVGTDGAIYVGGASERIAIFRVVRRGDGAQGLVADGQVGHPELRSVRALAVGPEGTLYAADDERGAVAIWQRGREAASRTWRCRAPIGLLRVGRHLALDCLVDHQVVVWQVDDHGLPDRQRADIHHDGPIWSMAALEDAGGALWLALGGVEDHALDRADGTFGYVDSFLFLYRIDDHGARRVSSINLGELGVITPKWLGLARGAEGRLVATATGYGGDQLVTLGWPADGSGAPTIDRREVLPGITSLVPGEDGRPALAANPLFDSWMIIGDRVHARPAVAPVAAWPRTVESRVGELLAFTNLMSPWAPTEGKASRFTCETCHFEGGIDGRVHFTGRGTVHATTKPLFGLFANRPHFTRALDSTMAEMVDNEFRVATKSSGRDPWFVLGARDVPWLAAVEGAPAKLDAVFLRRALMAFLIDFNHEPNRATAGRSAFDATERRGATLFRDRCADCHASRLVTDRADSEIAFDRWEPLVFSPAAPIVWARDGYEKTGVEPYVHADGARSTSLRRLSRKQPYFTSGTARTLEDVLERAAWVGDRFFHDHAPAEATHLVDGERRALRAFLELL